MKSIKKANLISILIVLIAALTLSACGSKGNTDAGNSTAAATTAVTAQSSAPAPDPFGKYNPGITLTSVKPTNTGYTFPEGQDIRNNLYTQEFENTLGITVKYDWLVDTEQYDNKLNISIASGDLPDFFLCKDSKTFINLAETGQLADLTDVFEKYASDLTKAAAEYFPEGMDSAKVNGKLLALPVMTAAPFVSGNVAWIREDWMKKYNLEAPKTMDDLIKIAETFMTNNPGSYGFGIQKTLYGGLAAIEGLANAYHAYPTSWVKNESGQIEYGSIRPEMKKALQVLQELYAKGLISKEFGVKDTNKVNEDLVSGKVGIEFGTNWNCYWPFPDLVKKDGNTFFKPYDIPSSDGQPVKIQAPWPISQYFVVNKNCKYPEAVIKMANNYLRLAPTVDIAKNNNIDWGSSPMYFANASEVYEHYKAISDAITSKDVSKLSEQDKRLYDSAMGWVDKKDPDGYGTYFQNGPEGSLSILSKCDEEKRILLTELRGSNPPIYAEKKATLDKLELEAFTRIIMGASLDEFDKFVDNWKKLGGEDATKEINDIYNR